MKIDDETTDVLIGGYLSTDAAHEDYDAVLNCGAHLLGAVVVTKDLEGRLSVEETDHAVAEQVEPAVTRAVQQVIGEAEGNHVKALKGALADAQAKMTEGNS